MTAKILSTVELGQTTDAALLDLHDANYTQRLQRSEYLTPSHILSKVENVVGKTMMVGALPIVLSVGAGVVASTFGLGAPLAVGVVTAALASAAMVVGVRNENAEQQQALDAANANLAQIDQEAATRPGFADRLVARRAALDEGFKKSLDQAMKIEPEDVAAIAMDVAITGANIYARSRKRPR